jgi:hypothetical protein
MYQQYQKELPVLYGIVCPVFVDYCGGIVTFRTAGIQ